MSFLICLLIFSIRPCFSTSPYQYGIIRNVSIKSPYNMSDNSGDKLEFKNCTDCLCNAFRNESVVLFTCTKNESTNVLCQFYYYMPLGNQIEYPRNDTDIYLMKNVTFEDDCCDTEYLIKRISEKINGIELLNKDSNFLAFGENQTTIITISGGQIFEFNRSTFEPIYNRKSLSSLKAVGYSDKKYYLGSGTTITVYDEILDSTSTYCSFESLVTTIRFLNNNQMLVGTETKGGFICGINENEGDFKICTQINGINSGQVHAFGIVNDTAFYVGWLENKNMVLCTKNENNSWTINEMNITKYGQQTSDIFIDDCKRVWVVNNDAPEIFIYQDKTDPDIITFNKKVYNLLILDNYQLVTSHSSGLYRTNTTLNCRKTLKRQ